MTPNYVFERSRTDQAPRSCVVVRAARRDRSAPNWLPCVISTLARSQADTLDPPVNERIKARRGDMGEHC
jgi:hypothetical protein